MRSTLRSGLVLCAVVASVGAVADPMMYFVDGERVVFTNTQERGDERPVPGVPAGAERKENARKESYRIEGPRRPFQNLIEKVAREVGISPRLLMSVVAVESNFDPMAVSPKGAQGLMQLMPATAKQYGVVDPFQAEENLRGGARFLRDLLEEFDGDLELALAAYNAGKGAVLRAGGIPRYKETQDYVRKVHRKYGVEPRRLSADRPEAPPPRRIRTFVDEDGKVHIVN